MEKVQARLAPEKTRPVRKRKPWILAPVIGLLVIAACAIPSPRLETPAAPSEGATTVAATASSTSVPTSTATLEPSSTPTWTGTESIEATLTTLPDYLMDDKGVPMAYVPAGAFAMGDDRGSTDEQPAHTVNLEAFYIDQFEVTNGFYKACVEAKVCQPVRNKISAIRSYYYDNSDFDTYPVIFVDWKMAQTYCTWRDARLPTEAEWEKAARGGTDVTYPWGDTPDCNLANYGNCLGDTSSTTIYALGQSRYGSHNMAGNVWEWVNDWYAADYYRSSPQENPQGPETGKAKVLRGGSWKDNSAEIRSVNREAKNPAYYSNVIGFRCAKDANP